MCSWNKNYDMKNYVGKSGMGQYKTGEAVTWRVWVKVTGKTCADKLIPRGSRGILRTSDELYALLQEACIK